jgi:hypothetical protein
MSEYQFYEFLAIDRPLDQAAQKALRSISSRARITSTGFTNEYNWGDLSGDPRKFMEQWFDLHLYFASWGTRRLMIRVPARLADPASIDPFLREVDWVRVSASGENLIIDIYCEEMELEDWEEDGKGRLGELAPLRGDLISGDLRLFYLLWLSAVQFERVPDDELEPLSGLGKLNGALEAFAEYFDIDSDLIQAAAESGADAATMPEHDPREMLATISESDKTELLVRVAKGDANVAAEIRSAIRKARPEPVAQRRTAGELRRRAQEISEARERAAAKKREAESRRLAAMAEKARRVRLVALKQRGDRVWQEVETEIERRNPAGYERAIALLSDLQVLADEEGRKVDFERRLAAIHVRHEKKARFIERLIKLRRDGDVVPGHDRLVS